MKYAIVVLLLVGIASAHTVTLNYAIRIGADANNTNATIRVNDTDYNTTTPASLTFTSLSKGYISSNNTTTMTALVSAGTLLNARLNNSYNSTHYLFQMTQDSEDNRFLIAATNGTYTDIEDKLSMVEAFGIVSSTFGNFVRTVPRTFATFIRLEYAGIDIDTRATWSGIGQLRIRNNGLTNRSIPNVTLEVIR